MSAGQKRVGKASLLASAMVSIKNATEMCTRAHCEGAEHHTRDDRRVSLEVRLPKMDHAVRHDHDEDGAHAHGAPQRGEHPASEEQLEREELHPVHPLPRHEVEPAARALLVKRVVVQKLWLSREGEHGEHHHRQAPQVDPEVLHESTRSEAHVEQAVFREQEFPDEERPDVADDARQHPPAIPEQVVVSVEAQPAVVLSELREQWSQAALVERTPAEVLVQGQHHRHDHQAYRGAVIGLARHDHGAAALPTLPAPRPPTCPQALVTARLPGARLGGAPGARPLAPRRLERRQGRWAGSVRPQPGALEIELVPGVSKKPPQGRGDGEEYGERQQRLDRGVVEQRPPHRGLVELDDRQDQLLEGPHAQLVGPTVLARWRPGSSGRPYGPYGRRTTAERPRTRWPRG